MSTATSHKSSSSSSHKKEEPKKEEHKSSSHHTKVPTLKDEPAINRYGERPSPLNPIDDIKAHGSSKESGHGPEIQPTTFTGGFWREGAVSNVGADWCRFCPNDVVEMLMTWEGSQRRTVGTWKMDEKEKHTIKVKILKETGNVHEEDIDKLEGSFDIFLRFKFSAASGKSHPEASLALSFGARDRTYKFVHTVTNVGAMEPYKGDWSKYLKTGYYISLKDQPPMRTHSVLGGLPAQYPKQELADGKDYESLDDVLFLDAKDHSFIWKQTLGKVVRLRSGNFGIVTLDTELFLCLAADECEVSDGKTSKKEATEPADPFAFQLEWGGVRMNNKTFQLPRHNEITSMMFGENHGTKAETQDLYCRIGEYPEGEPDPPTTERAKKYFGENVPLKPSPVETIATRPFLFVGLGGGAFSETMVRWTGLPNEE